MGRVLADQSMSLDGFSAGPNVRVGNPLGDGGEQLHEWMSRDGGRIGTSGDVLADLFTTVGAVVMGRRMLDVGEEPWGDEPPFHLPVFVVTHHARDPAVKAGGTTYTLVTGGIESALEHARATAGDKDVLIAGGANIIQQCSKAAILDELQIHLAHVLLGGGVRLLDQVDLEPIMLERTRVIDATGVTHLGFRVVK